MRELNLEFHEDLLPDYQPYRFPAMQRLVERFGGAHSLGIPRCAVALRAYRNQCFLAEVGALAQQGEFLRMALTLQEPKYGIANIPRLGATLTAPNAPPAAKQSSLF